MPSRARRTPPRPKASRPTPEAFRAGLPPAIAAELRAVRDLVRHHLPQGYEEAVRKNMIVWEMPLEPYPDTYNGRPLWYAALAAEERYLSLHLMPVYGSKALQARLEAGFKAAGKKLDMGKACIRFKTTGDPALDIARAARGKRATLSMVD